MSKPKKKISKSSVTGFVTAFLSPWFIVLIFVLLSNNIIGFYEPFGEWFYWTVINILVGCTLIFNRAGTAFSIIGLINAGRKNMGGKGFAITGIILAELQAVLYVFGIFVYLIQKLCAGAGP